MLPWFATLIGMSIATSQNVSVFPKHCDSEICRYTKLLLALFQMKSYKRSINTIYIALQ